MARPLYNPSEAEMTIMMDLFAKGSTDLEVIEFLDCCETTFYELKKRDAKFAGKVKRSKALYKQCIRRSLYELLEANDRAVAIHLSKAVLGNNEKQVIDAKVDMSDITDEELEEQVLEIINRKPDKE